MRKVFLGFFYDCKKSKYVSVFSDLIKDEIKKTRASIGKVFLMIKLEPGSWVHLSTLS
jgi:hypothetical protein